jgi:hypothetical protein
MAESQLACIAGGWVEGKDAIWDQRGQYARRLLAQVRQASRAQRAVGIDAAHAAFVRNSAIDYSHSHTGFQAEGRNHA